MATVMILDDDHGGIFHFDQSDISFPESIGEAKIRVARSSGARGRVALPYKTIESSAKGGGQDYFDEDGELIFENDEIEWVHQHIVDRFRLSVTKNKQDLLAGYTS